MAGVRTATVAQTVPLGSRGAAAVPPHLWGAKRRYSAAQVGSRRTGWLMWAEKKGNARRCWRQRAGCPGSGGSRRSACRQGLETQAQPRCLYGPAGRSPAPGGCLQGPFTLLLPEKPSGNFGVIFLLFSYLLPAGADLSLQLPELHLRGTCFAFVVHKIAINY